MNTPTIIGALIILAVFTAIVQGGLCALASVGVHQMYKQAKTQKDGQ